MKMVPKAIEYDSELSFENILSNYKAQNKFQSEKRGVAGRAAEMEHV